MLLLNRCPNCLNSQYLSVTEQEVTCGACGHHSEDVERDYYTLKFRESLGQVLELARGAKTADYGEAWQETGLVGIYIKLMIKHSRLRSLIWEKKEPQVDESVEDTLKDMIAYATYGLLCIQDGNIKGYDRSKIDVDNMIKELEENYNE